MNSESLFVWVYLPGQVTPVVAGKLTIENATVGRFVYGKSYLANPDAIPIDPVALPLVGRIEPFTTLNGYPGAILDACPDRWGIKAITRLFGEQSGPLGYLLLNDPGRAGCLAFSTAPDVAPVELGSREFALSELLEAAEKLEAEKIVDPELIRALHPGTGGARPKCNIVEGGAVWIGKFESSDDPANLSIPRLEHATMRLARACGINVAETRLEVVGSKPVCLVRRFDRQVKDDGQIARLGFISGRSVFFDDPTFFANGASGSYPRLSRWLPRYAQSQEDSKELFTRMAFNAAVRNTDDHELNHGLVYDPGVRAFKLSPAYDLVPSLSRHNVSRHALIIGDNADGTVENLVSAHAAFFLDRQDALAIVADVAKTVQAEWDSCLYEAGFDDEEVSRVRHCFTPLPVSRDAFSQVGTVTAQKVNERPVEGAVTKGEHPGVVLSIEGNKITQSAGRGNTVVHDAANLDKPVQEDVRATIKYKADGKGVVTFPALEVGRDRGKGRG